LARLKIIRPLVMAIAFAVALITAFAIRNTSVDIGIDFTTQPASPVVLGRLDANDVFHEITVAEQIRAEFSPHHYEYDIEVPEEGGGEVELLIEASPDRLTLEPENAWLNKEIYMVFPGGNLPARAHVEGWHFGPAVDFAFSRDLRSGNVIIRGEGVEKHLRLFSEDTIKVNSPDKLKVSIPAGRRLYRYYAQVPRKHLRGLAMRIDAPASENPPAVERLYINTFIPGIFYSGMAPPRTPPALVIENWTTPAASEKGVVVLFNGALIESSWTLTSLLMFLIAYPSFYVFVLLVKLMRKEFRRLNNEVASLEAAAPALAPFNRLEFSGYWIALFCLWNYFLLNFWPGSMNVDSHDQWLQATQFSFINQHPPFHTLIIWAGRKIWDSPACIAFLQITAMSGMFAWGFSFMRRAGVSRIVVGACFLMTALSLKNAAMAISLLKDTPYAIIMLGFTIAAFYLVIEPRERKKWRMWITAGICMGLMPLFRYNGLIVLLGMLFLFPLFFAGTRWRALTAAICGLLICLSVTQGLFRLIHIEKEEKLGPLLLLSQTAILIDNDAPFSNDEYKLMSEIRPLSDRWAYSKFRIGGTTEPIAFQWTSDVLIEREDEFRQLYAKLMLRNPLLGAKYFLERGEYLYIPWESSHMETCILGIGRNENMLASTQFLLDTPDMFKSVLTWSNAPEWNWLFWRPAIPLYICILATALLAYRRKSLLYTLPLSAFMLNTLSLLAAAIAQNARYQFGVTMAAGIVIGLAFLPKKEKGAA